MRARRDYVKGGPGDSVKGGPVDWGESGQVDSVKGGTQDSVKDIQTLRRKCLLPEAFNPPAWPCRLRTRLPF